MMRSVFSSRYRRIGIRKNVPISMTAAATSLQSAMHHFINTVVHGLFQKGDGGFELAGSQPIVAGRAGGIGFFKPAQRLVDGNAAVGAVQGYHLFGKHVFDLLEAEVRKAFPSEIGFPVTITEMIRFWIGEETGRDR